MGTSFVKLITIVMLSLIVSACGKGRPQVVTGIQVQTSTVDQDVMLSFSADLDLGAMTFPSVTLPIIHPRKLTQVGSVSLQPVLGGKNQIKIAANVSELADLDASIATLPNGNSVPLIANNPTIVIPLGSGAKLYLTLAKNAVALGVAVPIKTFDQIGSSVGSVNLFPVFAIDKVIGSTGIFTGKSAGQNGFAIVADVTQYVNMQDIFVPGITSAKLAVSEQIPAKAKEDKINSMILDLNMQRKKLQLR